MSSLKCFVQTFISRDQTWDDQSCWLPVHLESGNIWDVALPFKFWEWKYLRVSISFFRWWKVSFAQSINSACCLIEFLADSAQTSETQTILPPFSLVLVLGNCKLPSLPPWSARQRVSGHCRPGHCWLDHHGHRTWGIRQIYGTRKKNNTKD